jgi:hypothetical protein
MDSKIWRVNCKSGMERELVARLILKAIDFFNLEKPFMILSIFECDKTAGTIYIEAHNKNHVSTFINGMSGLFPRKVEMVPQRDVPTLLRQCT